MAARIPQLQTTLSHVSPDKAAEIRSAVSGALKYHHKNGLYSFEESIETTFVLPWDLNPQVEPQKLSRNIRDGIRGQLMDGNTLTHLEGCCSINYINNVQWQCRPVSGGDWSYIEDLLKDNIEFGYCSSHLEYQFTIYPNQFEVNFSFHKLMNVMTREMFEIRRLGFSLLIPLKTDVDKGLSLFHASSLGFWGIHDRMALLSQAVMSTLADPRAQVSIYDRWSNEVLTNTGETPQLSQWEAAKRNIIGDPTLHIFTLCNVIQRPVIIYSHPDSHIGGIYLPLLWEGLGGVFPCDSHPHLRNPLILGYDCNNNHFVPLVTFKGTKGPNPIIVPLHYGNGKPLPLHYSTDNEQKNSISILSKLMYIDYVSTTGIPHTNVLTCILNISALPDVMDQLIKRYQSIFL